MPASKKTVEQLADVCVDRLGHEKAIDLCDEILRLVDGTESFKNTIRYTRIKILNRLARKRAEAKF